MNPRLDYDALRSMYMEGQMSINQIAARQGVHPGSVYNKLKIETKRRGGTWPLRPPKPTVKYRGLVPSCGVTGYVLELKARGVTYADIARQAGVSPYTVMRHAQGRMKFLERTTAEKLMRAVEHFERQLDRRQDVA